MKATSGIIGLLLSIGIAARAQQYPDVRFTVYSDLPTVARTASLALGYTKDTWNLPGTAKVEDFSYETLVSLNPAVTNALESISLNDEDSWDCYMNHFEDYDWSELVEFDLASPMRALGWTRNMWDLGASEAITEDLDWDELSEQQREAAEFICYLQETVRRHANVFAVQLTKSRCSVGHGTIDCLGNQRSRAVLLFWQQHRRDSSWVDSHGGLEDRGLCQDSSREQIHSSVQYFSC